MNSHIETWTTSAEATWRRCINLLLYLNKDWQDDWHGNLDLWNADMSECIHSVSPQFNRCVIFSTVENSYHGHPFKLACPPEVNRKCLLLYYYFDEGRELGNSSTNYRPMPGTGLIERSLIAADRTLLSAYTFIKRRSKLGDDTISRFLKRF